MTRGIIDSDLKPSSNERKLIQKIIKFPPTRPLLEVEKQLVWKFRFSLMSEKKALTKFVRSVDWRHVKEAKQAVKLIGKWEAIDVADALELLSPEFERDEVHAYAVSILERADDEELQCYLLQLVQALWFERSDRSHLSIFLVSRALSNTEIASFLRWDDGDGESQLWKSLLWQNNITAQLCSVMDDVRNVRGSAQKKIQKLRESLSGITNLDEPTRSPVAPTVILTGVVPDESSIFKSTLYPLRLTFKTENGETSKIIFKKRDDLRQDQLVIQMVSLMDGLLKLENLDLHLTPYRVLATGPDQGMLEFIPSSSLAQVLSEHRKLCPDEDGPFGISAQCLETFIKSCAGYSVITYILGVGDRSMYRGLVLSSQCNQAFVTLQASTVNLCYCCVVLLRHLDNLLLTSDGRLFHVDFAFILGRDPKPFPPPMKLCKEMVEAMGGAESHYYTKFKSCCEAYNILRKSGRLILNLFKLMGS